MTNYSVGIVGAGWLGLALSRHLVQEGYRVIAATRSAERRADVQAAGADFVQLDLYQRASWAAAAELLAADTCVIAVPPGRQAELLDQYPTAVADLARLSRGRQLIFTSSTSVYGAASGTVTEATPPAPTTAAGRVLLATEQRLQPQQPLLLRLGGLVGPGRHPGRWLAGRNQLTAGNESVNLIHQRDVVLIMERLIAQGLRNELFNVVADHHPLRAEYYPAAAQALGLAPPHFLPYEPEPTGKQIDSTKIKKTLDYQFTYADPYDFWAADNKSSR